MSELLAVRDLIAGYGQLAVVRGVSLHVSEGEVVALLGPNGAGKTTTLLTACGLLPALGGEVWVCGRQVESMHASAVARLGVSLVPEDRALFFDLTVQENIRLGARGRRDAAAQMFEVFPSSPRSRSARPVCCLVASNRCSRSREGSQRGRVCWWSTR